MGQGAEEHKPAPVGPVGPMFAVLGPFRIGGARKVENLLFPSGKARFWEVREAAPRLRKRGLRRPETSFGRGEASKRCWGDAFD